MKKDIYLVLFLSSISIHLMNAQETEKKFEPNGKALGNVFFNYHYDLSENENKKSQFELLRSYLGYNYNFSEQFSTRIIFDVGYEEKVDKNGKSGTSFSTYLKNAYLEWKMNKMFTFEGGMIATHTWDVQEKIWGYRYINENIQGIAKFYTIADLGIKTTFKPIDQLEFHASIVNGEGYKKIQDNYGLHKLAFDVVVSPVEGFTFKSYYDILSKKDTSNGEIVKLENQQILNFFLGYEKKDLFRLGAEYDIQTNAGNKDNHQLNGISAYGTFIHKKYEFFIRYDHLVSNTLDNQTDPWNNSNDYSMMMGGIQYAPVKGVKIALNYQHLTPRKSGIDSKDLIYLNFEYKF